MSLHPNSYFAGATARLRTTDWTYETTKVRANAGKILLHTKPTRYAMADKMGFYLENKLSFLDAPGEWYFDNARNLLYLYPREGAAKWLTLQQKKQYSSMPAVEVVPSSALQGILLSGSSSFVRVSGIHLTNFNAAGISCMTPAKGLEFSNNLITRINMLGINCLGALNSKIIGNVLQKYVKTDNF